MFVYPIYSFHLEISPGLPSHLQPLSIDSCGKLQHTQHGLFPAPLPLLCFIVTLQQSWELPRKRQSVLPSPSVSSVSSYGLAVLIFYKRGNRQGREGQERESTNAEAIELHGRTMPKAFNI